MILNQNTPQKVLPYIMVLNSLSENNYIVGGAVRDALCGKVPHDYDLVTDVPVKDLIPIFEEGGFKCKETGIAHFVLNVYFSDYEIEISNFRKDVVCNGRQAEVEVGTFEEDALRRDFTINALYANTLTGEIIDPTGFGLDDIKNRVLRFVGNPKERIREDYLRVWRGIRLSAQHNLTIEANTKKAIRRYFEEAYKNSTPQRVLQEMIKLMH